MAANLTRLPFIRGPCIMSFEKERTQDTFNGHLFIPTLPLQPEMSSRQHMIALQISGYSPEQIVPKQNKFCQF